MHPPTQKYGILEFTKGDEIIQLGYTFGKAFIKKWREDGTLASRFGIVDGKGYRRQRRASHAFARSGSRMVPDEFTPSPVTPESAASQAQSLSKGSSGTNSFVNPNAPSGSKEGSTQALNSPDDEKVQGFGRSRRLSL